MSDRRYDESKITPASVIVDVGAHDGRETIETWIKHCCRYLALEPSHAMILPLLKQTELTSIKVVQAALTGSDDYVDFYEFESEEVNFGEGNSVIPRHLFEKRKQVDKYKVHSYSLQTLMKEYDISRIDLLFLDCEGAEVGVIQEIDGSEFLQSSVGQICVEFHPQIYSKSLQEKCVNLLKRRYDVFFDDGIKNYTFICRESNERIEK